MPETRVLTPEMTTSLQFIGDWNVWFGLPAALALAAAAWFLYYRESRKQAGKARWILPTLRAAAVFLVMLALTEPVLHHEKVIRELGRLFVFVDGSKSMSLSDEEMPPESKVAAMQSMGLLPRSKAFEEAEVAGASLSRARRAAERVLAGGVESPELAGRVGDFAENLGQAFEAIGRFGNESAAMGRPARGCLTRERWEAEGGDFLLDRGQRRRDEGPAPASVAQVADFEYPPTTETGFRLRIRGYLHPPSDGTYRFWIASDDGSELSLSPDERPERAERIAGVDGSTAVRQWDARDGQRSAGIPLKAGQRYYIEAILAGDGGENHLSVAWQVPGQDRAGPIPGTFLSPWDGSGVARDEDEGPKTGGADVDADERMRYFRKSLLDPARELEREVRGGGADPFKVVATMESLAGVAEVLRERLREYVLAASGIYYENNREAADLRVAVEKFDGMSRLDRIGRLMLDEESGLLSTLASQQDIEFVSLRDGEVDSLWWQRRGGRKSSGALPTGLSALGGGDVTDLGDPLRDALGQESAGVGVILLTDGRHNSGSSPVLIGKELGELGVPVFPVGIGGEDSPQDMAVIDVTSPETVYAKDRVKGEIVLHDFMKPGIPYKLRIAREGETTWEQDIESSNTARRVVEYDFPIEELVKEITDARAAEEMVVRSVPLYFEATVEAVATGGGIAATALERVTENNARPFYVQAVTRPRKVLILDGRPRWETRYLKTLFERDERWGVNALMDTISGTESKKEWKRGDGDGEFPSSRKELFTYAMIVVGDLPAHLVREEEMEWISDFTAKRGGGVVFIDGQRGNLRGLGGTLLGKMIPVEWVDAEGGEETRSEKDMPEKIELTPAGAQIDALRFVNASLENEEIWGRLPAPHWAAPVRELPGSEVLARAVLEDSRSYPTLVTRRYGAGRVFYSGIDEAWRWRYNVGDRYHQKYWVQLTNWVSERPFAIEGKYLSLAADKLVYDPGQRADFRVRVRDESGQPVEEGDYVAVVYEGLEAIAEIGLEPDPNEGGIFRGRTGELVPGEYEIAVREKAFHGKPREFMERTQFVVRGTSQRELDNLSLNRQLLEEVARNSGGQFFHEEEARNLAGLLEFIDRKKVISSQTILWSSYWWFVSLIGLLAAEWIVRKRSGYV